MEEIFLGTRIKNRREELGMSQRELCEGYCSPSTLSRIENNIQIPSNSLAKDLLERLGLSDDLLVAMVGQKNTTTRALLREIRNDMVRCRQAPKEDRAQIQEQIRKKMAELKKVVKPNDRTAQQFLLAHQALLGRSGRPYSFEEKLAMQLDAIRLTHPKFDPEDFRRHHYTMDECALINQIANTYGEFGRRRTAIDIYRQLLWSMEKNNKGLTNYGRYFCLVAHNYAIDLTLEKRYAEAIEIASQGRDACTYYGNQQFLPGFIAIQAECSHFLGKTAASWELYCLAYYTYKAFEDKSNQEIMRQEIKEYFGIEMPV